MLKHILSTILRFIGRRMPQNIRYLRSVPDRILKPLHRSMNLGGGVVEVLGAKMELDPREYVDAKLWFTPHWYDRQELAFLLDKFPKDGVLVDAGANIGFWSLMFASHYPSSKILAIEANPKTFQILTKNIALNNFTNIIACNVGLSDASGILQLFCNESGNRGNDSFNPKYASREKKVDVSVKPLLDLLVEYSISRIDIMKMDIEGFETRVLTRFLSSAQRSLWPRMLCVEVSHCPELDQLLLSNDYVPVLRCLENTIYALK